MRLRAIAVLLVFLAALGLTAGDGVREALDSVTARELRAHIAFLSDDLLEGRAPGTRGGRLAGLYIARQFQRLGLEPVGDHYRQPVPIRGARTDAEGVSLTFGTGEEWLTATYGEQALVWSGRAEEDLHVSGELVFVGYGVDAPEYDWNDFKGQDLRGKVLLVLVNDPPAPPDDPSRFGGPAMTYYGRWSYKFEEAARKGAAGVLLIHTTDAAGYPWSVVRSSWSGERLSLPRPRGAPDRVRLQGWLTRDFARKLLLRADINLEELYVRAARQDFRPVHTGITVDARIRSDVRTLRSANIVGMLRGSDPERRDQVVVYTAHYDHLGIGTAQDGDSIYNGAYDNASGVGLLLEVADAFTKLEPRPARSILFIATTAEEAGLLGARHYVRNPLIPLAHTVAVVNVDGANLWGETDDVVAMGAERSTLGRVVERRAEDLGLRLTPGRTPGGGYFFRSDHFPFARAGVPALYLEHGLDYRDRPEDWGAGVLERFELEHYHQPSDEFDPAFDLRGAVQQARLAFLVGYDVAQADAVPRWYQGSGFDSLPGRTATQ